MRILIYLSENEKNNDKIIRFLDDECTVVGYCSGGGLQNIKTNCIYFSLESIVLVDFDYLIVAIEDNEKALEASLELINYGIEAKKIIGMGVLKIQHPDKIPDLRNCFLKLRFEEKNKVIILGLSYSLRGINARDIGGIDLSWHGQDLYYNYQMISFIKAYRSDIYCNTKKIVLMFPVYYFNYDMSVSEYQYYSGQIYANRSLNDWHNAFKCESDTIKEYMISNDLFGKKFWREVIYDWTGCDSILDMTSKVWLPRVWKKIHNESFVENVSLFRSLLGELKDKDVFLVIPPIMLEAINRNDHEYYYAMKGLFLSTVENIGIRNILDYSSAITDYRFFSDYEHLNDQGRILFTERIKRDIDLYI